MAAGVSCRASLPAFLVFWIQRRVPEPDLWKQRAARKEKVSLRKLLEKGVLRNGILATSMNACSMFGYWGLFTWIPSYLSLPAGEKGGRGLSLATTTAFFLVLCVREMVRLLRSLDFFRMRLDGASRTFFIYSSLRRWYRFTECREARFGCWRSGRSLRFSGRAISQGMPRLPANFFQVKFAPLPWA